MIKFFNGCFTLPGLTLQTAIFGFFDISNNNLSNLLNHILMIFKLYIFKSRDLGHVNLVNLLSEIIKVKRIEKNIAIRNQNIFKFNEKWNLTDSKFVS